MNKKRKRRKKDMCLDGLFLVGMYPSINWMKLKRKTGSCQKRWSLGCKQLTMIIDLVGGQKHAALSQNK
jgi:hypothetical protein